MSERIIQTADLSTIESNLRALYDHIETVNGNIVVVNDKVENMSSELSDLRVLLDDYINESRLRDNSNAAMHRLTQIRQEIEKKFGHYDIVRRTTTGILQADDLGLVRKNIISDVTEELMITSPNYWLAPCLVALAAWINDDQLLANKALNEAINRDDEKTSLLFGLINRRAGRKEASLKWIRRYLENQDPESIDRKTIVILNAFAGGLFGVDSEGLISYEMQQWLDYLVAKPGFVEKQTQQWAEAISLKIKDYDDNSYVYLPKYSSTWVIMKEIMAGAQLHNELYNYFDHIFKQKPDNNSVKEQLDGIMMSLASDYDEEEISLKKEEKYNQLIIDNHGDKDKADSDMKIEESAFEERKDFTQLLTDAAMSPELSHSSIATQKFSIALSKEWILDGYRNIIAENRAKIPDQIQFSFDSFEGVTKNGENESELIESYNKFMNQLLEEKLSKMVVSKVSLYAGITIGVVGLFMITSGIFGVAVMIGGGLVANSYFGKNKKNEANKDSLKQVFEGNIKNGTEVIRALLAEVVDFRETFDKEDHNDKKVFDFLEHINPQENISKIDSERKILVK